MDLDCRVHRCGAKALKTPFRQKLISGTAYRTVDAVDRSLSMVGFRSAIGPVDLRTARK